MEKRDARLRKTLSEDVHSVTDATSNSVMTERPRELGDFKAVLNYLRLNFRLKGYVSRQYLWTVR